MTKAQQRLLARLAKQIETNRRNAPVSRILIAISLCAEPGGLSPSLTFTSPLTQITYRGEDAIRVCLGLSSGEAAWLLDLPAPKELWLLRARKLLREKRYAKYSRFLSQTCRKLFKQRQG